MANILIVGGAGYIGSAVVDLLRDSAHEVRVYDVLLWEDAHRGSEEFVRGDIRDTALLAPHLAWADSVIWLAALVADGACAMYPDLATVLNDRAVAWLTQHYDGRIVFPSTSLLYAPRETPCDEDAPLKPTTLYQETKQAAEWHLAGRALIVRLASLYGLAAPGARPRFDLVVNRFAGLAVTEGRLPVRGGTQSRAFCHVRDVASVLAAHATSDVVGTYNLTAENATILALAERICAHVPSATIAREPAPQEAMDVRLAGDRARRDLGFSPQRTLDDGIREVVALVRAGGVGDPRDPRYSNEEFLRARPLPEVFQSAFATVVR